MNEPNSVVHVMNEIPSRYSYIKLVPRQPCSSRVFSEGSLSGTRYLDNQLLEAMLKDTTTPKEAKLKQNHQAWAGIDQTRSEALWRTVVVNILMECHPGLGETKRQLTEIEQVLGMYHADTIANVGKLADVFIKLDQYREAEELRCRVLTSPQNRS